MFVDFLRKLGMMGLVAFIIGGLWVLAHWKALLSDPSAAVVWPQSQTDDSTTFVRHYPLVPDAPTWPS